MQIKEIIQSIPLVLEDDPAQEQVRDECIFRLRRQIACRWQHCFHLKTMIPTKDWERVKSEVAATIASLIELHASEIPFAPDMCDIIQQNQVEKIPVQDTFETTPDNKSSTSGKTSRSCLEHEFRWIEMGQGVWTVLVVHWIE